MVYMVTWIPSIYPLYVSINLPAPWILWVMFCIIYELLKKRMTNPAFIPFYTHIYIYILIYRQIYTVRDVIH